MKQELLIILFLYYKKTHARLVRFSKLRVSKAKSYEELNCTYLLNK